MAKFINNLISFDFVISVAQKNLTDLLIYFQYTCYFFLLHIKAKMSNNFLLKKAFCDQMTLICTNSIEISGKLGETSISVPNSIQDKVRYNNNVYV